MRNKRFIAAAVCLFLLAATAIGMVACGQQKAETVTVTFMNGGMQFSQKTIEKGATVTPPTATPEAPAGQEFAAWQLNGTDYDFTKAVNESIVLVATFRNVSAGGDTTGGDTTGGDTTGGDTPGGATTEQFTITFKDGGNVVGTLTVDRGQYINSAEVPEAPDKSAEHKTFVGWFKDGGTVEIDYYNEIVTNYVYIAKYETEKHEVRLTEANSVTTWETMYVEHGSTLTITTPNGYEVDTVTKNGAAFDLTTPVTRDLELVVTLKSQSYKYTFVDADGATITTVDVPKNGNAAIPTAPSDVYYTMDATEYAKLFNATENRTITLGTAPRSKYTGKEIWINNDSGIQDAKTTLHADFATGNWRTGSYLFNADGAYFTIYGNFVKLKFTLWLNVGAEADYDVYVDDILVKNFHLDAPTDKAVANQKFDVLDETILPGGMHTIKVVAHCPNAQFFAISVTRAADIKSAYDVKFENEGTLIKTENVAKGTAVAKPATDPTSSNSNKTFLYWSRDGENEYNFATLVDEDITLKAVYDWIEAYDVKFQQTDGTPIESKRVGKGENVGLPGLPSGFYWTASADEYEKMFNVTEARTITLGMVATSNYSNKTPGTYSWASESNLNTLRGFGFDFTNWKTTDDAGSVGIYEQANGAKLKITADLCKIAFATQVEAGKTCTYKVSIDGHLVYTMTIDNSASTSVKKADGYNLVCDAAVFPAGAHEVVIEIAGAGTLHAGTIVQH